MKFHRTSIKPILFTALLIVSAQMAQGNLFAQVVPLPASQTGTITGVVRTTAGVPAAGIRVTALRADSAQDAGKALTSLTQTDATGVYRLENIPPGRYYVTAGRVDLLTYFPGTLDMSRGTAISVTAQTAVSDIDFIVQDSSASAPQGVGLRSAGGPFGAVNLPVLSNSLNGVILNFQTQTGGAPRSAGRNSGTGGGPAAANSTRGGARSDALANSGQNNAAWWTNAALVTRLGLTDDQKKKIESTFEQYRPTLVLKKADLEKEESALARMLEAETMEPARIVTAQIERVVLSRAEMERTNSKMTLDIRQVLTRAQWVQLQAETVQQPVTLQLNVPGGRGGGAPRGTAPPLVVPVTPGAVPQR